ncbi:MAG: hypothetical protein A2157_00045 [Deltaproteobacteria bacterium RBG_16_47_11]|nr:MAG: hypothetical protein A2157_00045 [Deltaproteobacteria bacterium RBG_16_47_11]
MAERISHKILGQVAEGKWFDTHKESERTFKDLMERYMTEHSKTKKKSWKRDEVSLSHLSPFFGDLPLGEVIPGLTSQYKTNGYRKRQRQRP